MTGSLPASPNVPPGFDDGLVVVVKKDCPTCQLVEPVLEEVRRERSVLVLTQDDPAFPASGEPLHDADLTLSHRLGIEIVPTLLARENGSTSATAIGWHRGQWQEVSGIDGLGADLPPGRPGCGALNVGPPHAERLAAMFAEGGARRVELGDQEDEVEACFARGWTDGLPVVPPTPERVERMLAGTKRGRTDVLGLVAPDYGECTVEKVAVNAVMAGCRPEYMPVVLAAVEAALADEFNWHGLAATTYFAGPVIVVNGPVTTAIGMNSKMNVLGQGNRANATIGRALQLVLRNVGGARPGEVDRATLGNPGKVGFCFAEREEDSPWESLAVEYGFAPTDDVATLMAMSGGPATVADERSRDGRGMAGTLALSMSCMQDPKSPMVDTLVVLSPDHAGIFGRSGWSKDDVRECIMEETSIPLKYRLRSEDAGCGLPPSIIDRFGGEAALDVPVPKFRDKSNIILVVAGSSAAKFSTILGGWAGGVYSTPTSAMIGPSGALTIRGARGADMDKRASGGRDLGAFEPNIRRP